MELTHWPSTESDEGRQRCRLGPRFMSENGIRIGSAVAIEVPGVGGMLCRAMPRPDGAEGLISMSPVVCSKLTKSINTVASIPLDCIKPVRTSQARSVVLEIVVNDFSNVRPYRETREKLVTYIRNMLRYIFCAKDSIIDCSGTKLGKLYGIAYVIVKECSADFVTIANNTEIAISHITSKERFLQKEQPVTTPRVAGLDNQANTLKDVIMFPDRYPNVGPNIKQYWQRGCLLCGPPGCGKTSLVQQVCRDVGAFCLNVHCTDLTGSRPGESEEKMNKLFDKAILIGSEGPTVLFLDEVDSICPRRGSRLQDSRMSTHLLHLLDKVSNSSSHLAVIGATNTPQSVDPAIRNPGRLEKQVFVGIPSEGQRLAILRSLLEGTPVASDVTLEFIAEATPGYVGADLASVVHHANFLAVTEAKRAMSSSDVTLQAGHFRDALHAIRPSVKRGSDIFVEHKPVLWEDIGGLDDVKVQIQQAVEWPLKHSEAFSRLGIRPPRGVLLYGPPGCAKTTLVKAAATSCHVTFLSISGGQLFSPFVGDSERRLSEAFQKARAGAPSILFIDEIDSLVGSRALGSQKSGAQERVLSTLLNEMDGIGTKVSEIQRDINPGGGTAYKPSRDGEHTDKNKELSESKDNKEVLVVAATNRPDRIDKALLRPGRIDRLIYVPPPDAKAREDILGVHLRKMSHSSMDVAALALKTEGFTGADLENVCREAALHALSVDGLQVKQVQEEHFCHVLQNIRPSLSKEQMREYAKIQVQSSA